MSIPVHEPGMPFFAFGAQPPRTPIGRAAWRAALPLLTAGLRRGRREMNGERAAVGLAPLDRFHGGISDELALVATFPQLEYPRRWPAGVRGDRADGVRAAPSRRSSCRRAMSRWCWWRRARRRTRSCGWCGWRWRRWRTSRCGWWRRRTGACRAGRSEVPANAVVVDWLSYSQVMPQAALVICHGGHGTVARALARGSAGALLPRGRRHGGERRAGGAGRARG